MHRARSLRSLRGLTGLQLSPARSGAHCARRRSWSAGLSAAGAGGLRLCAKPGWGPLSAGNTSSRALCSGPERDLSSVSVVGSADPITWVRCRFIILLIKLLFELDLASEEFNSGAKQALVQVSHLMSTGQFHRLKGARLMMEYVETRTKALSRAQKLQLPVLTDDIIFLLPEDVTVVFDQYGRKFCSITMRFWFLTALEGPEDPEATRVFRVAPGEDGRQTTKVATAVYEFRRELTRGASPDWTVITVWHWHWTLAPEAPD
ncbi:m-AAA protease-interacting protein 1, mitochondrial [Boleophthalmus pectinirostris]|uniref:m-AAA protease-interacting protein 1, mitochondrial n=1 Tax=Boleophthalmus pectinirostris TaxID=150288 RepID=UPI00242E00B4|nr:m-AAA protease-interacting protein 1, mitochondrial [Boleophthalmus pectinirostris]